MPRPEQKDSKGRKLIILGLGFDVTDSEFLKFFQQYGKVEESLIMVNPMTGVSRGFGFVTYLYPADANKLLKDHETNGPLAIGGKRIDPKLAVPKNEMFRSPHGGPPTAHGSSSEEDQMKKIFVCRLPLEVTQDDVSSYFSQFGRIADLYMPVDYYTKQPRGIAFITFSSAETVDSVMEQHHEMDGRPIGVDRASPRMDDQHGMPMMGGRGGGRGRGRGRSDHFSNSGGYDYDATSSQSFYDYNGMQGGYNQQSGYNQTGYNQGGYNQGGYGHGGYNQTGYNSQYANSVAQGGFQPPPYSNSGYGASASSYPSSGAAVGPMHTQSQRFPAHHHPYSR